MDTPSKPLKTSQKTAAEQRLAKALRDNLHKRKAQQRSREVTEPQPAETAGAESDDDGQISKKE